MPNIKNIRLGVTGISRRRTINLVAIIVLILIIGFFFYWKHQKNNSNLSQEQRAAPLINQFLAAHDYSSYQKQLTDYANDYIDAHNYKGAEKLLSEIIKNVPPNKIISQTYRSYWYLYQQKGDTANRKKYAQLTADKLKQEGQSQAAAAFEQDAKGN